MKIHHPKSIKEAIDDLHLYFGCDIYSRFKPKHIITIPQKNGKSKKMTLYREDVFCNEKEFNDYLNDHFDILRKEIIKLVGEKEFNRKRKKNERIS